MYQVKRVVPVVPIAYYQKITSKSGNMKELNIALKRICANDKK